MVEDEKTALKYTLSVFGRDNIGTYMLSPMSDLGYSFLMSTDSDLIRTGKTIMGIGNYERKLPTIANRLQKQFDGFNLKVECANELSLYSELDVEVFCIYVRALLDQLSLVISTTSGKKNQLPTTFRKLREFTAKNPIRLDPAISAEIIRANWFDELKAIRDAIVHSAARTICFPPSESRIIFQVIDEKNNRMLKKKLILHNDYVAYFDHFFACYFSKTTELTHKIGATLIEKYNFKAELGTTKSYSIGHNTISQWTQNYLTHLESNVEF